MTVYYYRVSVSLAHSITIAVDGVRSHKSHNYHCVIEKYTNDCCPPSFAFVVLNVTLHRTRV